MSDATMIQLTATALFLGSPMVVAALLDRALRHVSKRALERTFRALLVSAGLVTLMLALVRPVIGVTP